MRYSFLGLVAILLLSGCNNTQVYTPKKQFKKTVKVLPKKVQKTVQKKPEIEAILQLDTKGHTGKINDIIVTKDGDIISASADKTIRVYNENGIEQRKILGQIGVGNEGKVFAMALSSDEKYLAVGGYFDNTRASANINHGQIRIYDYKRGKLLQVLKSHKNVIVDLAFSDDGDKSLFLISGSTDKTAKIWDVQNRFRLKDTIKFHKKQVYSVRIIKNRGKYFAVTAGYDNQVALYDMQKKYIVKSHKLNYKLQYLATNSKYQHIAVCGSSKEMVIYDFNLKKIRTIKSKLKLSYIAYDKKDAFLMSGTGSNPYYLALYNVKQNYKLQRKFKQHSNTIMAIDSFYKDNNLYVVSGGGDNKEIYIWLAKNAKVKTKMEGVGSSIWSVGIKDNEIGWGNRWTNSQGKSTLQKSINLATLKISKNSKALKKLNKISIKNGSYTLSHSKGGPYNYSDAVLNIKKSGKVKTTIVKDTTNGLQNLCYGWYKNYVVVGGAHGHLKVYDLEGKEIAALVGHTGAIWSIALDGDRLVSGSGDQTIKVWDMSKITSTKYLKPILNIFVSRENEWIVWSESGYFNSSVGGDKYVGYHLNQGVNKEAKYVGSAKFFDTLYRPDIIKNIWQTSSEKKAILFAGKIKKVKKLNIATSLPPVVNLLSSSTVKTTKKNITINFSVESNEAIKEIIVLHNGERVNTRGLKRKKSNSSRSVTIELQGGENIISIKAKNSSAISDEVLVYATRTTKNRDIFKPTLYLLSIGVSKYENPQYNLGVADKDAIAMSKMFKKQEGKIYKEVIVKTLTNKKANSDNILDGLDWIDKETTSKDVVIIFIAGHGVNDDKGIYYFLSHDANLEKLRRTAVKWTEIQDTITSLPSKVILLADTCHSGNITGGQRRDITSAVKSIINTGTGSIIMTATTGSGYSYEKTEWGHGAFTKSFLDGVDKMKADYDRDGAVTIKEIDLYVTNNVKKLTKGKQKPTTIVPDSIPDFAIGTR